MATNLNITQITPPRVPIIDERTGAVSREWYRWFYNLYTITGEALGITPVINGGTGLSTIPINGQLLIGNGTGYTLNTLATGSGISVTNGVGTILLANTGVLSLSGGTTGLSPTTATTGAISLGGILNIANGGTFSVSVPTAGAIAYGNGSSYRFTAVGTTGQLLTSAAGATPTWSNVTDIAVTSLSFGTTGLTPSTATKGAITVAGTLAVANGGTGLTSTPANGALDIGNGTGFTRNTLTAGSGVTITNGAGSISISATGTGGDVVGPASATDTAIALYNGTTGKIIQNSTATINSSGQLTLGTGSPLLTNLLTLRADAGASVTPSITIDEYGSTLGSIAFRRSGGTIASPSATPATSVLSILNTTTGDGTTYANTAAVQVVLETLATPTSQPTAFTFAVTPSGSITRTEVLRLRSTGAVAFSGATNYGSANQVLQSNGNAAPTWVSSVTLTNITASGNLTFSSTGQRIYGDWSTTTVTDRPSFQSSVVNGSTSIFALPNGTGVLSQWVASNNSDPTNASVTRLFVNATESRLEAGRTGTGTYLPLTLYTNGTEKLRIAADATGTYTFGGTAPRITGDFSNATVASRVLFQTNTANSLTSVATIPNGTSTTSQFIAYNNSDPTNSSTTALSCFAAESRVAAGAIGTGTYNPLTFYTNGTERLRITTNGGFSFGATGTAYGTTGQVLTSAGDAPPTWATPTTGTVTSVSGTGTVNGITLTGTVTSTGSLTLGGTLGGIGNSQLTNSTISGVALGGNLFNLTAGTGVSFSAGTTYNGSAAITITATGSGGTVTSVTGTSPVVSSGGNTPAISLAAAYGDTLNPYASKTANYVLAAPNGSAGVPTFRALVAADVPGSALTKTDDTNVTLTLGGSPTTALLNAASLALGWTGQLAVGRGGTGLSAGTSGGIPYFSSTSAMTSSALLTQYGVVYGGGAGAAPVATAAGTTGQVLTATTSGAPTWANPATNGTVTSVSFTGGIISVATATTTPALTVAGTSGGIPYFASGTTWASSAALAANAIVLGGGAGTAPATTTTGTGVVTALGVNTGTAGAFVVNGGALGTPSSGTVTNLTGTASININGTVGATAATTGAFTTLSASSTVSGTGFSTYLASPPAIGGTAAAAGTFTTLSGTTSVTTPIVKSASSLTLQTNGTTTAVTIDTSQNVGIGTAPSTKFHVSGGRSSFVANSDAYALSVGYASLGAYYLGANSANNALIFSDSGGSEKVRFDGSGNVGIGGSAANASAMLDVQSTTKGVRFPNMTTTQKNAVATPPAGLVVFDTTLAKLCVYSGSAWQTITSI